jgi:hypothetical protein
MLIDFYRTAGGGGECLSSALPLCRMHRSIELFLNAAPDADADESAIELLQFEGWLWEEVLRRGWAPFRTEWSVFDEQAMAAGQLDSLWIDPSDLSLHMVDWKRSACT